MPTQIMWLTLVLCILFGHSNDQAQAFSGPTFSKQDILTTQESILSSLEKLIEHEEENFKSKEANISSKSNRSTWRERTRLEKHSFQIEALHSFFDEAWTNVTKMKEEDTERSDENVFTTFHRMKMFVCRWKKFLYDSPVNQEVKQIYTQVVNNTNLPLPTMLDYKRLLRKLSTVQEIYNISFDSFADGKIKSIEGLGLSSADIHDIGMVAFEEKRYRTAIKWLGAAIFIHTYTYKREPPFNALRATMALADAYEQLGDVDNLLYYLSIANQMDKSNVEVQKRMYQYEVENKQPEMQAVSSINTTRLQHICQQDFYMNNTTGRGDQTEDTLDCYYQPGWAPYDRMKTEVISKLPKILLFRDIVSEREANQLRYAADKRPQQKKVASYWHVSKIVEIPDKGSEVTARMTRRLSYLTGLDTFQRLEGYSSSSNFHIMDYRFGDYDEIHSDAFRDKKYLNRLKGKLKGSGNRIATTLIFLAAPEEGGTIVFPYINKRVQPVKGALLYWFNVDVHGNPDKDASYGSCPVLNGNKQVAVKWIHEAANDLKRNRPVLKP